jgi:hypothetical protein
MRWTAFRSSFLSADSNFWVGFSRLLDVFGTANIYNESASQQDADYRALFSDWYMVGRDLQRAAQEFEASAQ